MGPTNVLASCGIGIVAIGTMISKSLRIRTSRMRLGCPIKMTNALRFSGAHAALSQEARTLIEPFVHRDYTRTAISHKDAEVMFTSGAAPSAFQYAKWKSIHTSRLNSLIKMKASMCDFRSRLSLLQRSCIAFGPLSNRSRNPDLSLYMELAAITKKQEELVSDASREAASAYAWGIRLAREDNVQRKNWANPDLQLLKMHYDAVFAVNKEAHDARKAKQSGRGARILLGLGTVLNSGLAVTAFCYGDSVLMMFHIAVASIAAMQYGRTTRALIPLEDELALLQRERKAAQKRISDHPTHDWFKAVIPFDSISMTIAEAENQMKACLENEGEADFRRRIDVFIDKRSDT